MRQAHAQQKYHLTVHAACRRIAGVHSQRQLGLSLFSPSSFPVTCSHGLSCATTSIHRTGKQHSKNQLGFTNSVKTSLFSTRSVPLCVQFPQLTDTGRRKMGGKTVFLSSSPDLSQNKVATTAASVDMAGLESSCSALLRQWMVFYFSMSNPPFPALS